jgi:hypothetical protein
VLLRAAGKVDMPLDLKAVYLGCKTTGKLPSGFLCSDLQFGCLDCYCKEAVQVSGARPRRAAAPDAAGRELGSSRRCVQLSDSAVRSLECRRRCTERPATAAASTPASSSLA